MTDFAAQLDRLDRWLRDHRPGYHAGLRPAATDAALDEFAARFGLAVPDEFRQLFRWHDGQADDASSLYGNWMFPSLAAIADTKELLDGMIGTDFDSPDWWRADWIPLLDNGGGDLLCLDVGGSAGGRPGQLLEFWHEDPDRPARSPDLTAWLAELVTAAEAGTLELS